MTAHPGANRSGFSIMSALLGGMLWFTLLVAVLFGNRTFGIVELLLLLAILVFTPLALDLVATPGADGLNHITYRLTRFLQPFAGAFAALSMLAPAGAWGGALAAPWLLLTIVVALYGLRRLTLPRPFSIEERCIDAALLYLPIGGVWFVASRAGISIGGFGGTIALLTAVHFHYAGFIAPALTGLAGRQLRKGDRRHWSTYTIAAIGVIAGPPLVALGITYARSLEVVAAAVLATSLTILASLVLFPIRRSIDDTRAEIALSISALASIWAMCFALLYALSSFAGHILVSIPVMALIHGAANAIFSLGGLIGWSIVRPAPVTIHATTTEQSA
jgi:hypothetical protein